MTKICLYHTFTHYLQVSSSLFSMHPTMNTNPRTSNHSLQRTAEEALIHDFDHVSIHPETQPDSYCLVVKILTPETPKPEWIGNAMKDAWIARFPFSFTNYHSRLFLPPNASPYPPASVFNTVTFPIKSNPIMTSTVLTSTSKGKEPMHPECTRVSSETPPEPIRLRNCVAPLTIFGSKRTYTRQSNQVGTLIIIGDFNDYLGFNDKSSPNLPPSHAMISFKNFITKFNLHPLPFVANRFTWKHGLTRGRLGWGIVNIAWDNLFLMDNIVHLPFYGSDHRAIKVECDPTPYLCKRANCFFFENHWLMDPDFSHLMRTSWSKTPHNNITNLSLDSFLGQQNSCINYLKLWSQSKNTLRHSIKDLQGQIEAIHNNPSLSSNDMTTANRVQSSLDSLLLKEEVFGNKELSMIVTSFPAICANFVDFYINLLTTTGVDMDSINTVLHDAFINNRIIFDNVLIANEVIKAINGRKNGKVGWAALKLDMKKAFDKVVWGFIEHIILHFGFPYYFVSLIFRCISTISFKICINHGISGPITPSRGIRHGNPSPLIFFSWLLKPCRLSSNPKSRLVYLKDKNSFLSSLGLDDKPFIDTYLGVPQCFGRSKKSSFHFILQRASSKLSSWNSKLFSKASKEILLKAVIQEIPSHEYNEAQSKVLPVLKSSQVIPSSDISLESFQPPTGLYKLNVDAAIRSHTNKQGFGAVVQDHNGQVIAGFHSSTVSCTQPIFAKAEAS
uniref:Reverse transcriptase domain-containing protein n=1 Tax=Cannabis sativa TaxID=3483 RepID=A0A803PUT5_CANSA